MCQASRRKLRFCWRIAETCAAVTERSIAMPQSCVIAKELRRGVARALAQRGYTTLAEVALVNNRRADLLALGRDGALVIVEVKSSVADFRSDRKWPEYREFCDRLYFAVAADFPAA